jgi:uncharacterized protein (TIGR00255 family)
MIISMTGFGDAAAEEAGTHYAVEIRSLNNRFFKGSIKLPDAIAGLEAEMETRLREKLQRGSVTLNLKMKVEQSATTSRINTATLRAYLQQLTPFAAEIGQSISIRDLLHLPGVIADDYDTTDNMAKHGPTVRRLVDIAIGKLIAMREAEGRALLDDLLKHTALIREQLVIVRDRAPTVIEEYHRKLAARVNQLLAKAELQVDKADLLKEVALFSERADVSEEIHRLSNHVDVFDEECRNGQHAGRKLDFITQEMLREANTIASKSNDASIAKATIVIKGAIDRLKEQVQNVE